MLLLVGLGNPSPENQNNRHNIGFKIINAINQKFGLSKQKPKFKGLLTTGKIGEKKVYAIKPFIRKRINNVNAQLTGKTEGESIKGRKRRR